MFIAILDEVEKELKKKIFRNSLNEDGYFQIILWDDLIDILIEIDNKHKERILTGLAKQKEEYPKQLKKWGVIK